MTTFKTIAMTVGALAFALAMGMSGCGDSTPPNTLPDLSHPMTEGDMGLHNNPDLLPGECVQPSDTCVTNPTAGKDIPNGCVGADVVKEDPTPFYPQHGYVDNGCKLPAAP